MGVHFEIHCFRNKTITLERMKRSIVNEVRSGDQEGRCLAQYKREMELLQQEKMSHVEELRQIHADINAVSVHCVATHSR